MTKRRASTETICLRGWRALAILTLPDAHTPITIFVCASTREHVLREVRHQSYMRCAVSVDVAVARPGMRVTSILVERVSYVRDIVTDKLTVTKSNT